MSNCPPQFESLVLQRVRFTNHYSLSALKILSGKAKDSNNYELMKKIIY